MTQRIAIRVDKQLARNDGLNSFKHVLFLFGLPVILAALVFNDMEGNAVANFAATTMRNTIICKDFVSLLQSLNQTTWSTIFCVCLLVSSFLVTNRPTTTNHKEEDYYFEFAVTVYPTGVQLSSSKGVPGDFIPRDCILDCCIKEVILVHRVYSSPRIVLCSKVGRQRRLDDENNETETVELFPQVELSYVECADICSKLREMLGIGHDTTRRCERGFS